MRKVAYFLVVSLALMSLAKSVQAASTSDREKTPQAKFQEPRVPIGSRIPRWPDLAPQREAVAVLHRFGLCVATTRTKEAKALLSAVPYSPEHKRWIATINGRDGSKCLDAGKMKLTGTLYRGAVAEGLYQSDVALRQRPLEVMDPPLSLEALVAPIVANAKEPITDDDRALFVARWLSYCIAHEGPDRIRAYLATKPASADEVRALNSMNDVFTKCLPKGQTLKVDRLTIRAMLAEALYQRAAASGAG